VQQLALPLATPLTTCRDIKLLFMLSLLNPSSSQDNKTFQQLPEQIIEAGADGDYEFIRLCFLVMCQ